jgi:hypothetical protein
VPVGLDHRLEHLGDVVVGDVLVEEVDEDIAALAPAERLVESVRPEPECEALLVGMAGDAAPALGERLRVAVRTVSPRGIRSTS